MATNSTVDNLDRKCFSSSMEIAKEIMAVKEEDKKKKAKELFNFITKSLGILQENGVFAFFIFLRSEKEKTKIGNIIEKRTVKLLRENVSNQLDTDLEKIQLLTEDVNTLLFAKSLIEKTLIYARYQAKSESG